MSIDRRSVIAWAKFLTWVGPVIVAAATVIITAVEIRDALVDTSNTLHEIRQEQVVIRSVQDKITSEDAEIRATQTAIMYRFDKLEDDNKRMSESLNARLQDFSFSLGEISARQEKVE